MTDVVHPCDRFYIYMNETGSGYSPFPQTFKLMFDGEIPAAKPAAAGK